MIRILIFIFIFNAFMLPTSAADNTCQMMGGSSSAMIMSDDMQSDMNCDMNEGTAVCHSIECVSSCAISIFPLSFSDKNTIINVAGLIQVQASFAYFYNIVLPIKTPPPLV